MSNQAFSSYHQVIRRAAIHSQQFRHTEYPSRRLSNDAITDIGFQLVSLYEELYARHVGDAGGGTPPITGTPERQASDKARQGRVRAVPYR